MRNGTKISKRPRGRPRSFDTSEVLERVRAVFTEKGFAAASLDELSEAAGLNRPSLYAAFGDKEQLYIHTLRFYGQKSLEGLDAILAGKGPIEKRLGQVFNAAIALYCAPPRPPGCLVVGNATVEAASRPKIAAAASAFLGDVEKSFERAFERAVVEGELDRTPSSATRARMAGAVLHTLSIRARLGIEPTELKALATSMIPAICR
jgi:TetR/AcrR family transcriptional regulator, copper-responsive repressor